MTFISGKNGRILDKKTSLTRGKLEFELKAGIAALQNLPSSNNGANHW